MRPWRARVAAGAAAAVLTAAVPSWATEPASSESPASALAAAEGLRATGKTREAIVELKRAREVFPDHEPLGLALADAYLEENNPFWALRVLGELMEQAPPACESRAWIASIRLGQAELDAAEESLEQPDCFRRPEVESRFRLLQARIDRQRGRLDAAESRLERARETGAVYQSDLPVLQTLEQSTWPGREPFASWNLDLGAGWTSNGLLGSPVDPSSQGHDTSSPLAVLDARLRLIAPTRGSLRASVEPSYRHMELTDTDVRALGYRQPSLRTGALLGTTAPRLLVAHAFDAVQIVGGDRYDDGPIWYSEGNRVELELEATDALFVFGGAGRRHFRERSRTRWEFDQGLAYAIDVSGAARLMAGASVRWYRAENPGYRLRGASLVLQLQHHLPARWEARMSSTAAGDDYPRSKGYFAGSGDSVRQDLLLRMTAGVWTPPWEGARAGLEYTFSRRWTTASSYAFSDHRFLLHVTWAYDSDRAGLRIVEQPSQRSLPYTPADATRAAADELRVRDLMRQDESVKRGSSCLK